MSEVTMTWAQLLTPLIKRYKLGSAMMLSVVHSPFGCAGMAKVFFNLSSYLDEAVAKQVDTLNTLPQYNGSVAVTATWTEAVSYLVDNFTAAAAEYRTIIIPSESSGYLGSQLEYMAEQLDFAAAQGVAGGPTERDIGVVMESDIGSKIH